MCDKRVLFAWYLWVIAHADSWTWLNQVSVHSLNKGALCLNMEKVDKTTFFHGLNEDMDK